MIRAAIFDADGTLLDSMPVWRDAGTRYLAGRGIAAEPDLSRILFPMSFEEGAEYLRTRYALPEAAEEIMAGVSGVIGGAYRREIPLKPGAEAFLAELERRSIPAVIATTGDAELIAAALRRTGAERYFRRIFTCTEFGVTKREPDVYLAAARYLGAEPRETAVFEDALHALRTARGAGFFAVAVEDADSAGDLDEIRRAAHVTLRDFTDLDNFWRTAALI